mmetsp:Transcript_35001/g.76605  ORF Transcript_35001/g.76605 Transcript_35001/m.76605 type:complete len:219 (-) Transcript_35001:242-898(-)
MACSLVSKPTMLLSTLAASTSNPLSNAVVRGLCSPDFPFLGLGLPISRIWSGLSSCRIRPGVLGLCSRGLKPALDAGGDGKCSSGHPARRASISMSCLRAILVTFLCSSNRSCRCGMSPMVTSPLANSSRSSDPLPSRSNRSNATWATSWSRSLDCTRSWACSANSLLVMNPLPSSSRDAKTSVICANITPRSSFSVVCDTTSQSTPMSILSTVKAPK